MKSAPIARPGQRRRQPAHLQLVGHHHRERELEQVVVAGAEELGPEERREAALAEQRELVRVLGSSGFGGCCGNVGVGVQAVAPDVRRAARAANLTYDLDRRRRGRRARASETPSRP